MTTPASCVSDSYGAQCPGREGRAAGLLEIHTHDAPILRHASGCLVGSSRMHAVHRVGLGSKQLIFKAWLARCLSAFEPPDALG